MSYTFTDGKYQVYVVSDFGHGNDPSSAYSRSETIAFEVGKILVPFSTATTKELATMINAYYDGAITLEQIKSVWSIGDTRTVHMSAMSAVGVSESHRAQSVEMSILDFNHDILTTPINGKTKALISLNQKNVLRDANVSDHDGRNNTEIGYINPTDTNDGGWRGCTRRAWCNSIYYPAIENGIRKLVKKVDKESTIGNESSTIEITSDYVWLLSEYELWGSTQRGITREGSFYPYFNTYGRNKLPTWDSSRPTSTYWLRSPAVANLFCIMNGTGTAGRYYPSNTNGIACNYCL